MIEDSTDLPIGSRQTGLVWRGTAFADSGRSKVGVQSSSMTSAFADWTDHGIGFWMAENETWAEGYAGRIAERRGGMPLVLPIRYDLCNALEIGDLDEAATDMSLRDIAGPSAEMHELLIRLRNEAGFDGDELDAPCVFELTNTPDFVGFARSKGYDGMVGYEDGGYVRVICAFGRSHLALADDELQTKVKAMQGESENGK